MRLPQYYHWLLHVSVNFILLISCFIFSINQVSNIKLIHFFVLGAFFIFWTVFEYLLHRFILHGPLFAKLEIKKDHSINHHGYFDARNMFYNEPVDINRIFLFTKDLFAVVFISAVISVIIGQFNYEVGVLCFIASIIYSTIYEITHLLCHLDIKYKNKFLINTVAHHKIHHQAQQMNHSNFAVVFPIVDSLFKTRKLGS